MTSYLVTAIIIGLCCLVAGVKVILPILRPVRLTIDTVVGEYINFPYTSIDVECAICYDLNDKKVAVPISVAAYSFSKGSFNTLIRLPAGYVVYDMKTDVHGITFEQLNGTNVKLFKDARSDLKKWIGDDYVVGAGVAQDVKWMQLEEDYTSKSFDIQSHSKVTQLQDEHHPLGRLGPLALSKLVKWILPQLTFRVDGVHTALEDAKATLLVFWSLENMESLPKPDDANALFGVPKPAPPVPPTYAEELTKYGWEVSAYKGGIISPMVTRQKLKDARKESLRLLEELMVLEVHQ